MTIIRLSQDIVTIDDMTKLWLRYRTTNLWRFMIIIIFFRKYGHWCFSCLLI